MNEEQKKEEEKKKFREAIRKAIEGHNMNAPLKALEEERRMQKKMEEEKKRKQDEEACKKLDELNAKWAKEAAKEETPEARRARRGRAFLNAQRAQKERDRLRLEGFRYLDSDEE